MESVKETAVEWLIDQVVNLDWKNLQGEEKIKIFKQAKEMEKQQIMKAVDDGFEEGSKFPEDINLYDAEEYFNETYGGNK